MNITITVTRDDIAKGTPGNACACPIRIAIARALPHLAGLDPAFTVGPLGLCINGNMRIRFPDEAHHFMHAFDDGRPVKPFGFVLDVPDHLVPAGAVPAGGEH